MRYLLIFIKVTFVCITVEAQSPLNFDMEVKDNFTGLLKGWTGYGEAKLFTFKSDSLIKQHGNYSLSIENRDWSEETYDESYPSATYSVKAVYAGRKVAVTGYLKTEKIKEGYAGLFINVKANKIQKYRLLSSDGIDLDEKGIKGTNDWQPFSLEIEYDEIDADSIHFGVELTGGGKVWLDNLTIEFDGKDISVTPLKKQGVYPARLDTVFRHTSGISSIVLDNQQIVNLSNLGMLWGFLKYHHPAINKGNYNWDAELFRVLPAILAAKNKPTANKAMEAWVDKLGKPEQCAECIVINKDKSIKLMPDYGNLFKPGNLSPSLIAKLQYILKNRSSDIKYYIRYENYGYPDFKNEDLYAEMIYPDAGYRLLALYRYWNIIQYFYPYRNLISEDWKNVLPEFIPKFLHAQDSLAYILSCSELVTHINDSHATLLPNKILGAFLGNYFSPVQTRFIENRLVVTGYYVSDSIIRQKIKMGDIITKIDSKSIPELIKRLSPIHGASNYPTILTRMRTSILRSNNREATLDILRDGKTLTIQIERVLPANRVNIDADPAPSDSSFKIIQNNIGYLFPAKFKCSQSANLKASFKNAKGIIIDFRCYPRGCTKDLFLSWIKSDSSTHGKHTKGNANTPGLFTFGPQEESDGLNKDSYKGKVVVIVNETTQSAAEGQTMLLQSASNVTVLGSTTAGTNGNIAKMYFPGNSTTHITGIGIYYPDGSDMQRVGVKIDIPVKPTIKGIKEGRDELMERAVKFIETGK